MKIVPDYREGLEKELKDCGIDPEQGLGREIVKQFEFSFELHDRVKALEEETRKKKSDSSHSITATPIATLQNQSSVDVGEIALLDLQRRNI